MVDNWIFLDFVNIFSLCTLTPSHLHDIGPIDWIINVFLWHLVMNRIFYAIWIRCQQNLLSFHQEDFENLQYLFVLSIYKKTNIKCVTDESLCPYDFYCVSKHTYHVWMLNISSKRYEIHKILSPIILCEDTTTFNTKELVGKFMYYTYMLCILMHDACKVFANYIDYILRSSYTELIIWEIMRLVFLSNS